MHPGNKVKPIPYHALMKSIAIGRATFAESKHMDLVESKWYTPISRDYLNICNEVFVLERNEMHPIMGMCWIMIGSKGKIRLPELWIEPV